MDERKGSSESRQSRRRETVRKNFNLPQAAIDRARAALGTKTETETVLRALETAADLADFRRATDSALRELIGKGGIANRFGGSDE
jgi:hypothetical protein